MKCAQCGTIYHGAGPCPFCASKKSIPAHRYYAQEFARLQAGEKPRLNVAALLAGPVHTLYRGCYKRFFALYAPCLITAALLLGACLLLGLPGQWQQNAGVEWLHRAAWLLLQLCGLWGVGLCIYNGNTFNQALYHKQKGQPYLRGHILPVLILLAVTQMTASIMVSRYIYDGGQAGSLPQPPPYSAGGETWPWGAMPEGGWYGDEEPFTGPAPFGGEPPFGEPTPIPGPRPLAQYVQAK